MIDFLATLRAETIKKFTAGSNHLVALGDIELVNQQLTKTFPSLIDNQPKICYTISVVKLQIQPKEAIIMMNTYIYRMSYVSPAVC